MTVVHDHLKRYAARIREQLRANPDATEPALAPAFQELVERLLPQLPAIPQLTVSPEFRHEGVGRPDIALVRQGQPARAFVELKAPSKSANPERWRTPHDRRQFERLKELAHWSACNFADFELFGREERIGRAIVVPEQALAPDTPDRVADEAIDRHDHARFLDLLATLARAEAPVARSAQQLAELMAHSARLVRSAVQERIGQLQEEGRANDPLMLVRNTFQRVLYAHPEAGGYPARDFDALFSSAFAQTLAFGLLLVREATNAPVDENAWRQMPDEHPLLKAALRVLSEDEVTSQIGIGFDVMRDTVNSFAPEILALRRDGTDPILYFYEDFLETFDPEARDRYGVYYTPIEVVRYMVGALDRALRDNLGTRGLRDPDVTILDPATGTGTFMLGVAERVRDQVMEEEGGVAASMALRGLANRLFGFELLIGPYAVAHYRLHHALRVRPPDDGEAEPQPVRLDRLGVYLTDTLSRPDAVTPVGQLGIQGLPIDEERAAANEIKARREILAIIGNPPYRRLKKGENETLVGRWMDDLWGDLKRPVSEAGWGNQLNTFPELSVAFWRWGMWKLFEAENAHERGVIAFITNRKFLTGKPYAGLRKMMRERFDQIDIIDLRGDGRTGARADILDDQNVFNIRVGVCITVAVSRGQGPRKLADVRYLDAWTNGLQTRRQKLAALEGGFAGMRWVSLDRKPLDDFRPVPFPELEGLSLENCFKFFAGGAQTARDEIVYNASRVALVAQIRDFLALPLERAKKLFRPTRRRPLAAARAGEVDEAAIVRIAFRPLDFRYLYADDNFVEYMRTELQEVWGDSNHCIYAMPFGTGRGAAVWSHSWYPDYQALSERGGYAFPLYNRREGPEAHNLRGELLAGLTEAYGEAQSPEDMFDAILCLLSAQSYTRRFAEDLEDTFPHIPFPADPEVFRQAVEIGREIRGLEAFEREPAAAFRPRDFCRIRTEPGPDTVIGTVRYAEGELSLWEEDGRAVTAFTGLPQAVWDFSVSGYRVLPRWIDGRSGLPFDNAMKDALRDVAARIHELLHWFAEADLVLEATLADTLTREELGFAPEVEEAEADQGDE